MYQVFKKTINLQLWFKVQGLGHCDQQSQDVGFSDLVLVYTISITSLRYSSVIFLFQINCKKKNQMTKAERNITLERKLLTNIAYQTC